MTLPFQSPGLARKFHASWAHRRVLEHERNCATKHKSKRRQPAPACDQSQDRLRKKREPCSLDVEVLADRCYDLRTDKPTVRPNSYGPCPFETYPASASTLYDDFRGLPQVDFQRVGRKLASACLPNGRIDHDVIQGNLAKRRHYIIQRQNNSCITVSVAGTSRIRGGRGVSFWRELH